MADMEMPNKVTPSCTSSKVHGTQVWRFAALNNTRRFSHLIVPLMQQYSVVVAALRPEPPWKTNPNGGGLHLSHLSRQQETLEERTSSGSKFGEKLSSHIWAFCQWMKLCLPRNEIHISHLASLMSSLIRSRWADKLRFAPAVCCGQTESTHVVRSVELSCSGKPSRWLNTKYRISLEFGGI